MSIGKARTYRTDLPTISCFWSSANSFTLLFLRSLFLSRVCLRLYRFSSCAYVTGIKDVGSLARGRAKWVLARFLWLRRNTDPSRVSPQPHLRLCRFGDIHTEFQQLSSLLWSTATSTLSESQDFRLCLGFGTESEKAAPGLRRVAYFVQELSLTSKDLKDRTDDREKIPSLKSIIKWRVCKF